MAEDDPALGHRFFCREWAFAKLWACLEQRPSAKTCGVIIIGGPGTGKTAFCMQLATSCKSFPTETAPQGRHVQSLQSRVLASHFCQANNANSVTVQSFILNLVEQLSASPLLKGYKEKVLTEDISTALSLDAIISDPDESFRKAVLFPLLETDAPESTLLLIIDSIDETTLHSASNYHTTSKRSVHKIECGGSKSILELLESHHHLFPQWLLLVISARRCVKNISRPFTGFRRIALDDLRRNHVVRDVQQYILCRLDTEPTLRHHLSRETAEMLNQLHIKSNGCILYIQKVLDGVVDGWVTLREIRDIPGTLNGLYLWLCQRLFPKKQFQKVLPLLAVMLAARSPITAEELRATVGTKFPDDDVDQWLERRDLLNKILHPGGHGRKIVLFHHSFAEWLLDVKHCTQKYLVDIAAGHVMLAMNYSKCADSLDCETIQEFAFHLTRIPLEGQLRWWHLPLWLVFCGATVKQNYRLVYINDTDTNRLLKEAGACLPAAISHLFDDVDADLEEEEDGGEEERQKKTAFPYAALVDESRDSRKEQPQREIIKTDTVGNQTEECVAPNQQKKQVKDTVGTAEEQQQLVDTPPKGEDTVTEGDPPPEEEESLQPMERKRSTSVGRCSNHSYPKNGDPSGLKDAGHHVGSVDSLTSGCFAGRCGPEEDTKARFAAHSRRPKSSSSSADKEKQRRRQQRHRDDPLYPYLKGGPVNQVDAAGRTLLHTAAHQGDASLVCLLIEKEAAVNSADRTGQTPLNLAARHGHSEVVSTLLTFGAAPDHADDDGWTPLRSAAWAGHYNVVLALLNGQAQVDLSDVDGRTALRAAAWGGHEDVVNALLRNGAAVNRADAEGRTPLVAAAYMGHSEIVEALIKAGANVNHADIDGRTALSVAALCVPASEGHLQVASALLDGGANVDHPDRDGLTPLLVAAFEGHVEMCELLLEYEADVDHVDKLSRTPLLAAASMAHAQIVEKLLFWGCYVDHIDFEGRTVLSIAAAQGSEETVRLLLNRGLDETHRANAGWTPLHYAAFEGHVNVVTLLMSGGARVNEVDNDGKHALVLAAHEGHTAVVTALLDAGGDLNQTSHDGRSAVRVAALEGHMDVARELVSRGANIHYKDADGRSTLYLLALEDRIEMAAFLLRAGAHVDETDLDGRTPLHVTAWQGHSHMAELLVTHGGKVDALDREKRTALQSAAWQGHAAAVKVLLRAGARVEHACGQGATALSIAAQEGHEECVAVLLQFGANPGHADGCGRTAIKVALKGGHVRLAKMLEDHLLARTVGGGGGCVRSPVSPRHSPDSSTVDKRRSISSNISSSTRSSGPLLCHRPPMDPPYAHRTPLTATAAAMSFTQQLQACGRGRRPQPAPVLTPLDDDPASPIYASPPTTPTSPMKVTLEDEYSLPVRSSKDPMQKIPAAKGSRHRLSQDGWPQQAVAEDASGGFTFTQDQHMRIILGTRGSPESRTRNKRNGIVTNPSLKAAQAKAAHILRNGFHGRPRTPNDRNSSSHFKKETPL